MTLFAHGSIRRGTAVSARLKGFPATRRSVLIVLSCLSGLALSAQVPTFIPPAAKPGPQVVITPDARFLPETELRPLAPSSHGLAVAVLPLPRLPAGPAVLSLASASPVAAFTIDPKTGALSAESGIPVIALPAAKAAAPKTLAAQALPEPKLVIPQAPAAPSGKAAVKAAGAPASNVLAGAKPSAAAKTGASAPAAKPLASPKPAAPTASATSAAGVKAPVPIQRSSAPVTTKASPAPAKPQASPSPSPAAPSPSPITDPHALPEYQLVTPPGPSAAPAPLGSLPEGSQALQGVQGQTITVRLQGRGWMFTGTGKTPAGVSFMEKLVQQDAEQFRFRLDETGSLSLAFQRQDVASGLMERQVASLQVIARGGNPVPPVVSVIPQGAGTVMYEPEYPVSQERALKASAVPAKLSVQIPGASASLPAVAALPPVESVPSDPEGILALAKKRELAKQTAASIELYERLLKDHPANAGTDEVLFRLAKALEGAGEQRNLKRSYELYVRLQNEYQYSAYVDQAKERARYIQRTYFRQ